MLVDLIKKKIRFLIILNNIYLFETHFDGKRPVNCNYLIWGCIIFYIVLIVFVGNFIKVSFLRTLKNAQIKNVNHSKSFSNAMI